MVEAVLESSQGPGLSGNAWGPIPVMTGNNR